MVEFTLILPVLVALALGAVELGRIVHHHHVVNKSVRDAARYLGRVQATCPSANGRGSFAQADAQRAFNLAMRGSINAQSPLLLPYWTAAAGTLDVWPECLDNSAGTWRGLNQIRIVNVRAEVPYADIGFLSFFGIEDIRLAVLHQQFGVGE